MPPFRPANERFAEKHAPNDDGCWIWTGTRYRNEYGCFWDGARNVLAHRFAYELVSGEIPNGVEIDHTCNTRSCVNPAHLALVTHSENRRLSRERKTTCSNGHTFDESNTYWYRGNRYCRTCRAVNEQHGYRRRKAAAEGRSANAPTLASC